MNILFLNHTIESCGVYQYGLRLVNILKKSDINNYIYQEIDNYIVYLRVLNSYKPDVIIYNYHCSTMAWLNNETIQKTVKNIGISHESDRSLFDIILSIDPDETENNNIFNIPRPIYQNVSKIINTHKITNKEIENFIGYNEGPNIPIFGSFGFGFQNKGFDKIISIINSQYDKAIIKLIITYAHFDPNRDININSVLQLCGRISLKPNIKLMITHNFLSNEEILLFLKSNTCNIFLYDKMMGRGISSVIDYAISVNKPFIISDSDMFRNIYSDDICVYKTNISTAIENSNNLLPSYLDKYSNDKLISKVDSIIHNICYNNLEQLNKDKDPLFGCNMTAYYHINNFVESANVTNNVYILFDNFIKKDQLVFTVCNDIFTDTCINRLKTLFINLTKDNKTITISYKENSNVSWINIIKTIHCCFKFKENRLPENRIEVSIGEIIDKYSILELKNKYIKDESKLCEIQKEMKVLDNIVYSAKQTHFYKLLLYINERIWVDTDNIKNTNENNKDLIESSKHIFDNNQKRFRIKNYFNILEKSNIKECKSYSDNKCFININSQDDIYNKIPEINYLCISYDIIYINDNYKQTISNLFKNPNIKFIEDNNLDIIEIFDLSTYTIKEEIRDIFEFDTIKYISGGKLGDFLNQLSVICEKYYETGRKGILYISDTQTNEHCEKFLFTLEKTHEDTYNIIKNLNYIKDYKIHNNEPYDINLSQWRINFRVHLWSVIYNVNYNVSWGKHQWLNAKVDNKWVNKILINVTPYRFLTNQAINLLKTILINNINDVVFISNEKEYYDYFSQKLNINIEYYTPTDFDDVVTIVNSCKMAYLGLSSMQVIANALHKKHIIIGTPGDDIQMNNLIGIIPHILDILV